MKILQKFLTGLECIPTPVGWYREEIAEAMVRVLHRLSRGELTDGGIYKRGDVDIIQTYPDGRSRIRFRTVPATETPLAIALLFQLFNRCWGDRKVPYLILNAALNPDFLRIHPFRDGNGRVSRLLFLQSCYYAGILAGRYISMERAIKDSNEQYYDALEKSSQAWHEGTRDPLPYIRYVLFVVKTICRELERCVGKMTVPMGTHHEKKGKKEGNSWLGTKNLAQRRETGS